MGAKYTTQAASGFDASPPSDDGTQAASNLVTWAMVKTKLASPVKTLADAINTALVTAFDYSIRQVSSSDNTVAGDHMRTVEIAPTVSSSITVSLMDATTATTAYMVRIRNSSTIAQTVGRVTGGDTIDGVAANVTIQPKETITFLVITGATGYITISRAWAAEKTFTGTLTGCTTSPTDTVNYTKIGNQVTIQFQAGYTATSNATTKTITGMPAAICPARDTYGPVVCIDNGGTAVFGSFKIGSNGTITVYPTAARGNWTGSGTTTIDPICFTYQVS